MTGYDIPYSFDDRYYIRSMSSNESTGPEVVVKLVMSRGIDPLRGQPSDVQDLTFDMLYAMMVSHGLHPRGDEGFYRSHGMLDEKGRFNLTAYLVSDQNSVPMQVVRFNGTDRASMSTRCDFGGRSIIATVTAVLDHISSYMVTSVDLSEGVRRETDLFDFESFREAWINACVHNAWRAMVPPSVMVFDDRIEVVSYGTVPFPMSLEDFYRGDSHPVDVSLFELFTLVGLTGQSGHGVPTIVARYGREAFLITESSVIVTLPFAFEPDYVKARRESERRRSGLDPDRAGILTYLESHPEAKLSEVSEHTGMSLSSVKKAVSSMKSEGLLRNDGTNRNSRWTVLRCRGVIQRPWAEPIRASAVPQSLRGPDFARFYGNVRIVSMSALGLSHHRARHSIRIEFDCHLVFATTKRV